MIRENIYAALFARVAAATWSPLGGVGGPTTWGKTGRKILAPNQIPADNMPALFQVQVGETVVRQTNLPPKYTLHAELHVFVTTLARQDLTIIPSSVLNVVLDAIETALEPQGADGTMERCTLGGLVYTCRILGKIEIFEGDLGDLGVAVVPVEILVP